MLNGKRSVPDFIFIFGGTHARRNRSSHFSQAIAFNFGGLNSVVQCVAIHKFHSFSCSRRVNVCERPGPPAPLEKWTVKHKIGFRDHKYLPLRSFDVFFVSFCRRRIIILISISRSGRKEEFPERGEAASAKKRSECENWSWHIRQLKWNFITHRPEKLSEGKTFRVIERK